MHKATIWKDLTHVYLIIMPAHAQHMKSLTVTAAGLLSVPGNGFTCSQQLFVS